jgi:hypothetical protein
MIVTRFFPKNAKNMGNFVKVKPAGFSGGFTFFGVLVLGSG